MSYKSMTQDEILSITQILIECKDVIEYFKHLVEWARDDMPYDEREQKKVDKIIETMPKKIEEICEPLQMEVLKRIGVIKEGEE